MSDVRKFQEEMTAYFQTLPQGEAYRLVFGEGERHARLMLIGEAPGEQEALQGRPFVGKAGKNLDGFLAVSGLDRRALYITNTVKFRPTKVSAAGRTVNRPPSLEEIRLCEPWLLREIELIDPELIVTMGNVPLKTLLGQNRTIGQCHGRRIDWRDGRQIYPLYHPASVIYNPSLKEVYQADVIRLGDEMRANG